MKLFRFNKEGKKGLGLLDASGKAIEDQYMRQERWIEFFSGLLNRDKPAYQLELDESQSMRLNIKTSPPTYPKKN